MRRDLGHKGCGPSPLFSLFFSSTNASFLPTIHFHTLPAIPHKEVYKNRIKVGVDEKKKTQGMRRDLAHLYGVFIHHLPHANSTTPLAASAAFFMLLWAKIG